MSCLAILALLCLYLLSAPQAQAADAPGVAVSKLSGRVHVDGILDEPAWAGPPAISNLTQVEPRPGEAPTEATRVWLSYSRDALYIAVRCEDRMPDAIVATEMRRDAQLRENDNIEFIIDTYHDHRNAYYFATNAEGALVDGRVTENRGPATEWDGIWHVRTRIDARGWTAEFQIPFKTIGFDPSIRDWGFNISRHLARVRETSRWASPSLDVRLSHAVRAGDITGLEGLSQGVGLDFKPYAIGGFTRDIRGVDRWDGTADAGGDVFYRITSNLISSTTFNTDFAETEVDARQVNLTRFPLFFPEKRSFFLEDAGIFEFARGAEGGGPPGMGGGGGDLMPFFSRRIGLLRGNEVPIRAGQKVTGKIGRFDLGVLGVRTGELTRGSARLAPGTNLAVGRVKANFASQSYIGAIFTHGDPTGETSNQMGGADLRLATANFLNRGTNFSLTLFGSRTRTSGISGRDAAFGGEIAYPNDLLQLSYRWAKIGENYDPALGFVRRRGVRVSEFSGELSPRPRFWGIRQMSFEFEYADYYNLEQHASETKELELTPFQWRFDSGELMTYQWGWNREEVFEPWEITDGVVVPAGAYTFNTHSIGLNTSESRPFSVETDLSSGSFFSGTRRQLEAELTWRKDRHLTTSFQLERNWIRLREENFSTSLLMYRLDYSFTPLITLANFVQYDTESRNIGLQSRLRWIMTPGNEFFVVLNHAWQENQFDRFEAAQTRFRVKLNYTFRF